MLPRVTPHPLATMEEPIHLPLDRAARLRRSFIRCTGNGDTPGVVHDGATRARAGGWDYHELASGHDAMVTAPRELAALLIQIAEH